MMTSGSSATAARHAAGDLVDAQRRGAAQADRVELHQDDVADHDLGQVGVLAQREGDVLEHGEVGEQRAELEQHPEAAALRVQPLAVARIDLLAVEQHAPRAGAMGAADQAQQGRLAAAGAAENGRDLAARELQRHVVQDRSTRVVAERDVVDLDEGIGVQAGIGPRRRRCGFAEVREGSMAAPTFQAPV